MRIAYTADSRHVLTGNGNGTLYLLRAGTRPTSDAP
jgi:hypothetical protein